MKRYVAIAAVALAACGDPADTNGDGIADGDPRTPDSVTSVAPATPKGRVAGRIVTSQGLPLAKVQVQLSGKEAAHTETDATGMFVFDKVPAGSSVGLVFTREGYGTAWWSASVPSSAGNFPLSDAEAFVGPIAMIPADGSITFQIVGYDGALIAQPTGMLDVTPGFLDVRNTPQPYGSFSVQATGADGLLRFTGVPKVEDAARLKSMNSIDAKYSIYIPPVLDANGAPRYAGFTAVYSATDLLTKPWTRTIVLPNPGVGSDVSVVGTNVGNLVSSPSAARANLVPRTGPLYVVFNQRINPGAFVEVRTDETDLGSPRSLVQVTTELNAIGNQLRITPKGEGFIEGQKYYVTFHATSRDNPSAAPLKATQPFFGGSPGSAQALGTVIVRFTDKAGTGEGNLNAGETLEILFERNIGRGTSDGFQVPIYFDYDLDNSGTKGDAKGERGHYEPFCIPSSEALPKDMPKSGYARRAAVAVGPTGLALARPIENAETVPVVVALSESMKCNASPVHSVWGENLLSNTETTITRKPEQTN